MPGSAGTVLGMGAPPVPSSVRAWRCRRPRRRTLTGMTAAIETRGLTKRYGRVAGAPAGPGRPGPRRSQAGEIFGFLGPNGAGKSTTIRLLLGFLHPTRRAGVGARPRHRSRTRSTIRRRVGYLPGGVAFWDGLTGERLLDELAALSGRPAGPPRRAPRAPRAEPGDAQAPGPRLLARDAPEARHHPGAPARSGARDPRRAVGGPRSAHAARVLRDPRRPAGGRPDDLLLVPRPVRGGARVRPRGDRPPGPARGARGRGGAHRAAQAQRGTARGRRRRRAWTASPACQRRARGRRAGHLPARRATWARSWRPSRVSTSAT